MSITLNFSDKQILAIQNSNSRIVGYCGAVRSGKSYAANWKLVDMCRNAPEGALVLCGKSQDSIKRNIVEELMRIWPQDLLQYFPGKRELYMCGRQIYCIGASDERAESKIRGGTFSGALVDEATLLPESFFVMLLSRLSRPGAQLVFTSNPDSPFHWLKRNFIDREGEIDITNHNFLIEDNPSLDREYVENLKKEYRGLWNKRYIQGQWCLAEGSVFDFFSEDIHVIDEAPAYAKYWLCGIDYGTTNPCGFTLLGFNDDVFPNLWVEKEYYFDSKKEGYQKTDNDYAQDLYRFLDGYGVKRVYIDPSAASFKVEIRRMMPQLSLVEANNDVLNGIRVLSKHLSLGNLKVRSKCKNLIKEFQSYVWDSKKAERGLDEPVKAHDHLCISGDSVVNEKLLGKQKIKDFENKEVEILAYKKNFEFYKAKILKTGISQKIYKITLENGNTLRCTKDHKFYTKRGYIELQYLLPDDDILCYS